MNTASLALLMISTAVVSLTLAEICPYLDPKCRCQNSTVICGNLDTIPPLNTGNSVIPVDTLLLKEGQITSIPDNSLPPGLVSIHIEQNPLTDISDDALRDSATTLNNLYLMSVNLTRVPDAFTNLTDLRNLTFNVVDINDWNSAALGNIEESLTHLKLIMVDWSAWPDWISRCHSLNQLVIYYGNMSSIPETAFNMMSNTLTALEIHMSLMTQVPEAFHSLKNLTTLDLSDNKLSDVNGRPGLEKIMTFPLAETLQQLTVWNTFLIKLPNFSNASSLVHLDFFMNDISQVTSDMLPRSLVYLSLGTNKITEITDASFTGLSKLEILYLSSNPITEISLLAFRDLVSLRILDLSETMLTQIPLSIAYLSSLESLIMKDVSSLECPCPPSSELVSWHRFRNAVLATTGVCCNQESIASYLTSTCTVQPPCAATMEAPSTDDASILVRTAGCSYACLIFWLIAYFCYL
ncbi:hypothetical protein BsWGS_16227 [Bradybaena similaris]